jgi:lipooligosaccharide transport system permease protein
VSGGGRGVSLGLRVVPPLGIGSRRAIHLIERSVYLYRRTWLVLVSGFFEPLFYLLSIGFGIGALVGSVPGPDGQPVPYQAFVAPALLASSAMNGAIFEVTFNVYGKLRWEKVYDAVLATPLGVGDIALGEIGWALIRGLLYSIGFVLVMLVLGLVRSPLFILAVPAAVLIGFAFAAVGMAATTFIRSWQDFDLIQLVILPLFLFSATFYPLDAYPDQLRFVIQLTPLYHAVDLIRSLALGVIQPAIVVHVAYLLTMGLVGLVVVSRRLERLLLK